MKNSDKTIINGSSSTAAAQSRAKWAGTKITAFQGFLKENEMNKSPPAP